MALNFGKLNFSTSFNPTSAFPLDARSYFESYELAAAAAATAEEAGSSNTVYYYGETIAVNESGAVTLYIIQPDKTLKEVGSVPLGDGDSIEVVDGEIKIKGFGTGYYAYQEGEYVYTPGFIAGLQPQVRQKEGGEGYEIAWYQPNPTTIEGLETRLTAAEGEIDTLQATVGNASSGLVADVDALETSVSSLGGRMDTAESNISTLQTQIQDLTGAMHFVGTSTTDPVEEGPTIADHSGEYEAGDVCLYDGKEYIYDGTNWSEFGDEGNHLTKAQADTYYVPLARTVNGKALSDNITLTPTDIGADAAGTAQAAIQALDMAEVQVGAAETIAAISETDGVVAVTKQNIAIPHTAITDWDTEFAGKQDALPSTGTGLVAIAEGVVSIDTNDYLTSEEASAAYLGLHAKADSAAEADKVANPLTVGSKTYNGSAEVTITASDLGALTAIPQATSEALGGVKVGYSTSGNNVAVQLDGEGNAYVVVPEVAVPDVPAYTAGDSSITIAPSGDDFTVAVAANGITTDKIADGAVTNDKLGQVDVAKLYVAEGDTLILNGGNAQ